MKNIWLLVSTFIALTFCTGAPKLTARGREPVKLVGYVTSVSGRDSLHILDFVIHVSPGTKLQMKDRSPIEFRDVATGMLAEAHGIWTAYGFDAEKISFDWDEFGREIHRSAYLEAEPAPTEGTSAAKPSRLGVDGELLVLDSNTKWTWDPSVPQTSSATAGPGSDLAGRLLSYRGARQDNGTIAAEELEVGGFAPADAFQNPNGVAISLGKDAKTGVQFVEFRHKEKVLGRKKLFPVPEVQDYVSQLGSKLLPSMKPGSNAPGPTFRFLVIEEPEINAAAFPDGTVLVNTGLLGAVENEAQLAFVLGHETSHTLQAHCWRQREDTRTNRILITSAVFGGVITGAVAGQPEIGLLAPFLDRLGMAWVWNGYARQMENQADRLAVENLIAHGYDPRQALGLFRIIVAHHGDTPTSALWSNHDSTILRGSFLMVQIQRRYSPGQFDHAIVSTRAFDAMRDALGPVKME